MSVRIARVARVARVARGTLLVVVVAACSAGPAADRPTGSRDPVGSAFAGSSPPGASASASCRLGGPARSSAALVPASGVWLGMGLDWGADSVSAVAARVGPALTPAAWVQFAGLPLDAADRANLDGFVEQVRTIGGIGLITLEPRNGLAAVTPAVAADAANVLAGYQACGLPIIVRFGHEMNGSWYPWGQDPEAYINTFRTVADAIHAGAPGVAMLWAPNSGAGYPFRGGAHSAAPGSAQAAALDTNEDGALTATDDPYAPYWPGDDAVDWVGMSIYHFGNTYPWGANVVPRPGAFAALLSGGTAAGADPAAATPDFHAIWAVGHAKPLAIAETAALWRPTGGGAAEIAIKQTWWRQVFSGETRERFPAIRLIGWFEWRKPEPEVDDVVDWRLTANPDLVSAFSADLPRDWLRFAQVP